MTAQSLAAALDGRRSGSRWVAKCPAHDDRSPSLSIAQASDGKLLVHCFSGCSQDAVVEALRARGLWQSETRFNAEPKRTLSKNQLRTAKYWRRAFLLLLEQDLDAEKAKLIDPTQGAADLWIIRRYTDLIGGLNAASDECLMAEYAWWSRRLPRQCAALVRWAREWEGIEHRALIAFLLEDK